MRVWLKSVYESVFNEFINTHEHNTELTIEFSNKTHYFIIKEGASIC